MAGEHSPLIILYADPLYIKITRANANDFVLFNKSFTYPLNIMKCIENALSQSTLVLSNTQVITFDYIVVIYSDDMLDNKLQLKRIWRGSATVFLLLYIKINIFLNKYVLSSFKGTDFWLLFLKGVYTFFPSCSSTHFLQSESCFKGCYTVSDAETEENVSVGIAIFMIISLRLKVLLRSLCCNRLN